MLLDSNRRFLMLRLSIRILALSLLGTALCTALCRGAAINVTGLDNDTEYFKSDEAAQQRILDLAAQERKQIEKEMVKEKGEQNQEMFINPPEKPNILNEVKSLPRSYLFDETFNKAKLNDQDVLQNKQNVVNEDRNEFQNSNARSMSSSGVQSDAAYELLQANNEKDGGGNVTEDFMSENGPQVSKKLEYSKTLQDDKIEKPLNNNASDEMQESVQLELKKYINSDANITDNGETQTELKENIFDPIRKDVSNENTPEFQNTSNGSPLRAEHETIKEEINGIADSNGSRDVILEAKQKSILPSPEQETLIEGSSSEPQPLKEEEQLTPEEQLKPLYNISKEDLKYLQNSFNEEENSTLKQNDNQNEVLKKIQQQEETIQLSNPEDETPKEIDEEKNAIINKPLSERNDSLYNLNNFLNGQNSFMKRKENQINEMDNEDAEIERLLSEETSVGNEHNIKGISFSKAYNNISSEKQTENANEENVELNKAQKMNNRLISAGLGSNNNINLIENVMEGAEEKEQNIEMNNSIETSKIEQTPSQLTRLAIEKESQEDLPKFTNYAKTSNNEQTAENSDEFNEIGIKKSTEPNEYLKENSSQDESATLAFNRNTQNFRRETNRNLGIGELTFLESFMNNNKGTSIIPLQYNPIATNIQNKINNNDLISNEDEGQRGDSLFVPSFSEATINLNNLTLAPHTSVEQIPNGTQEISKSNIQNTNKDLEGKISKEPINWNPSDSAEFESQDKSREDFLSKDKDSDLNHNDKTNETEEDAAQETQLEKYPEIKHNYMKNDDETHANKAISKSDLQGMVKEECFETALNQSGNVNTDNNEDAQDGNETNDKKGELNEVTGIPITDIFNGEGNALDEELEKAESIIDNKVVAVSSEGNNSEKSGNKETEKDSGIFSKQNKKSQNVSNYKINSQDKPENIVKETAPNSESCIKNEQPSLILRFHPIEYKAEYRNKKLGQLSPDENNTIDNFLALDSSEVNTSKQDTVNSSLYDAKGQLRDYQSSKICPKSVKDCIVSNRTEDDLKISGNEWWPKNIVKLNRGVNDESAKIRNHNINTKMHPLWEDKEISEQTISETKIFKQNEFSTTNETEDISMKKTPFKNNGDNGTEDNSHTSGSRGLLFKKSSEKDLDSVEEQEIKHRRKEEALDIYQASTPKEINTLNVDNESPKQDEKLTSAKSKNKRNTGIVNEETAIKRENAEFNNKEISEKIHSRPEEDGINKEKERGVILKRNSINSTDAQSIKERIKLKEMSKDNDKDEVNNGNPSYLKEDMFLHMWHY